jgi:hypothetical protein
MGQECCENTTDWPAHLLQEALHLIGSLVDRFFLLCYTTHLNTKGADMQTNCKLYYKIVKTKNKTYRVVFTFDAYNRITVKNTALITGDVANFTDSAEYIQYSINNAIARAKAQLRTNTVVPY